MAKPRYTSVGFLSNLAFRGLMGAARILPYRWRVPLVGFLAARIFAPLAGQIGRAARNIRYIHPDMPMRQARAIAYQAADNFGRTLAEFYAPSEFLWRLSQGDAQGPGLAALEEAQREGRPVILVSGHFGNYQAPRALLAARGYTAGGLYRPMNNAWFNDHYIRTTRAIAEPLFARDRRGMGAMVKFLKQGGMVGMLIDQFFRRGEALDFLGKPAPTALSAAELALKYNALLVPAYGTRGPDGLTILVEFEAPIPHGDAVTMTQALNDSLSERVRATPGQWLWMHRRWKPERQRRRAAAKIGPKPTS